MVLLSFSIPSHIDLIKSAEKHQTTRIPRKPRKNGTPALKVGEKVQLYYRSRMKSSCHNCIDTGCFFYKDIHDPYYNSKPCKNWINFFGESEIVEILHYHDGDYRENENEIWMGYTLTHADDEDAESWAVADGFKDYGSAYDYFSKSTGNPHWADQNLDVIVWQREPIKQRWDMYDKQTIPYCSSCGTIPCKQQNEKDNMISGMMIKSCSDWTNKEEKTSINPRLNIER